MVGQKGLSESVLNEIEIALDIHELIKIKLSSGDKDDRQSMIGTICEKTGAELIHSIGHVAAFYLKNPKKPKIQTGQ